MFESLLLPTKPISKLLTNIPDEEYSLLRELQGREKPHGPASCEMKDEKKRKKGRLLFDILSQYVMPSGKTIPRLDIHKFTKKKKSSLNKAKN